MGVGGHEKVQGLGQEFFVRWHQENSAHLRGGLSLLGET